ncbi:MAG TPA: sigma-70 family RNA polymerase sigma factor [Vicinamibacteria bacterium]|nr:sigma-70 family RNA polymerase sigma factor [Vicinamibacteria bacterium]
MVVAQPVAVPGGAIGTLEGTQDREAGLVRKAQAGDTTAFEELYRLNMRRIYALCFRLAGDAALAEELTQDVFVRAWQKIGSFRGESAFSSWLYPLAVNVALSERRARRRRLARVFATEDPTVFEKPSQRDRPDLAFDLEKAMAGLPPGARSVFVLHDVQGLRHQEIAGIIGVALGTSKAQLHRARKLLREALRK